MRENWTSVDDLAADLKAGMRAGERRALDPAVWKALPFDDHRYEARFQALEARLGGGWDVMVEPDRTVIYRHGA
jgi:hypothetical protein